MRYEEFKRIWDQELRASQLPVLSRGEELLDLGSMGRKYETYVEPIGGQDVKPFQVTAALCWRWSSALTARSDTTGDGDGITREGLLTREPALSNAAERGAGRRRPAFGGLGEATTGVRAAGAL